MLKLHLGLTPALLGDMSKLLLAAKKIRRATYTEFRISFVSGEFCRTDSTYAGKLRSISWEPNSPYMMVSLHILQCASTVSHTQSRYLHVLKAINHNVGTISYELYILCTGGLRRMRCIMQSIPFPAIQGWTAPTLVELTNFRDEQFSSSSTSKTKLFLLKFSSTSLSDLFESISGRMDPLNLKTKAPRWHEHLQCWFLNFTGHVTVASVKNFQLVAAVEPSQNVSAEEQEKVILQFGKIGKDIITMDYRCPFSAFHAFAICLSCFDTHQHRMMFSFTILGHIVNTSSLKILLRIYSL